MTDTIRNWHTAHRESLTRGQRAADVMRNSMGSGTFVGGNRQIRMLQDLQQLLDQQTHGADDSVQES